MQFLEYYLVLSASTLALDQSAVAEATFMKSADVQRRANEQSAFRKTFFKIQRSENLALVIARHQSFDIDLSDGL
jgi:hypothetical protein